MEYNKIMKISFLKSFLKIIFVLVFGVFCFAPFMVSANSTHNMSGYAWSSNIGWISFNCTNDEGSSCVKYGVNKDATGYLTGYAWSPNIGWIQFGGLSGWPTGSGTTADNAKVTGSNLTGWAKAISGGDGGSGWDGWIALSGTGYGITLDSTSSTPSTCPSTECAWGSEVMGWIDFSGVTVAATPTPTLSISPTSTTKNVGQTQQFVATYDPDGSGSQAPQTVTSSASWSSLSTSIATVNSTGLATAVASGSTSIRATYSSLTASATITVVSVVMSGSLTASNCTIAFGASSCNTNLVWSINNTEAVPSAITSSGMADITLSTPIIGNSYSGTKSYTFTSPATRTFYLYNNGEPPLATATATATVSNTLPLGNLDGADCNSFGGWAYDSDTSSTSISVGLYDGMPPTGTLVGTYPADIYRSDVNDYFGITGNHGFSFQTPASLKDNVAHSLYVYAIDSSGGTNALIGNSPTSMTCSSGIPPSEPCSSPAVHYLCGDGSSGTNQISSPSKWVWTCGTTSCSEKKTPGYIEQ
jgi:hypothetical protein